MGGFKAHPDEQVRDRINLGDPYDVWNWAKLFRVPELDLAIAVHRSGPLARDVAMFLGKPWR